MPDQKIHEAFQARGTIRSSSNRSFGFVFTAVFVIIGLSPLVFGGTFRLWALVVAAVFLIISLARPYTLAPLNQLWTKFGLLLHRIVSPVIMAVLFFLVVTPVGLLMKVFGKRPLNIGFDHSATTYWIDREPPGPTPESMTQQF